VAVVAEEGGGLLDGLGDGDDAVEAGGVEQAHEGGAVAADGDVAATLTGAADAADLSARLKVIGEVAAGRPFERKVGAGEAARIFTGGVIPDGADAVIIQEDTRVDGDHITITEAAVSGRHIRPAGVDFREGDLLLTRGRRLTDRDLSLAAGMNYPELAVHRRPKVAVLATGDELVMPGSTPGPGQIVYSNGYGIRALARAEGAEVVDLGIAADTVAATAQGIRRARELDKVAPAMRLDFTTMAVGPAVDAIEPPLELLDNRAEPSDLGLEFDFSCHRCPPL